MIFGSRLLSLFTVSAFYSFLKYLRYTTNRQENKFEQLQLTFKFWSPRRNPFSDPLRNRNVCLDRDPYYGNHCLQRLNLSKRFKPVLICRCVSLHRILQGIKCAAHFITSSHTSRYKVRCADDNCRTRCWDGQKTKLSPPAEMLKWTPLVQLQRWISNSFVKLTLLSKKRSCSVATQLSLYSNLKVSVLSQVKVHESLQT